MPALQFCDNRLQTVSDFAAARYYPLSDINLARGQASISHSSDIGRVRPLDSDADIPINFSPNIAGFCLISFRGSFCHPPLRGHLIRGGGRP